MSDDFLNELRKFASKDEIKSLLQANKKIEERTERFKNLGIPSDLISEVEANLFNEHTHHIFDEYSLKRATKSSFFTENGGCYFCYLIAKKDVFGNKVSISIEEVSEFLSKVLPKQAKEKILLNSGIIRNNSEGMNNLCTMVSICRKDIGKSMYCYVFDVVQ